MKYIRTKNRIWKTEDVILIDEEHDEILWQKILRKPWFYIQEVKQADTIEELIDEYVAKKDCSRPFVIKKYEIYSNLQFGFTIYGAIWTDKGLIYVAKMNEKGELELI